MDDLKLIFYIVVAIAWMVINNYKKIGKASKERDFSKPDPAPESPAEVVQERRVKPSFERQRTEKQPDKLKKQSIEKSPVKPPQPLKRTPMMRKQMLRERKSSTIIPGFVEGGGTHPSEIVHFEDLDNTTETGNKWLEKIKNADMKEAIVLSEILKRPYN